MLFEYLNILIFIASGFAFIFIILFIGRFLRPNRRKAEQSESYECGEEIVKPAWFNFNPRFYIIAITFIIFDVEIIFLFPVATVMKQALTQGLGWLVFLEILFFLGILVAGLLYVGLNLDLNWIKKEKQ